MLIYIVNLENKVKIDHFLHLGAFRASYNLCKIFEVL